MFILRNLYLVAYLNIVTLLTRVTGKLYNNCVDNLPTEILYILFRIKSRDAVP
jgi:hypothetical protein